MGVKAGLMSIMFSKRSARVITVLVGIIVFALAVVHYAYPIVSGIQQVVLGMYLGYMGVYMWADELTVQVEQQEQENV